MSLRVFLSVDSLRARQNTAQLVKYSAVLNTKTSNKICILSVSWSLELIMQTIFTFA